MKVVLERGSTHIRYQIRVVREGYDEFGLDYRATEDEIVHRELAEYEACDAIAVPTEYAARTFVAEGVPRSKMIINPYGVDLAQFTAGPRAGRQGRVRILFVGRLSIQKGLPWLLAAARLLAETADIHLVGPIDDEAPGFLAAAPPNVVVRGPLMRADLPREYDQADIFCLPSLEEGGVPLTLLQAMASGLPSVVTPAAQGPVRDGEEGLLVAPRAPEALADALARLIAQPDARIAMGAAARAAVTKSHGWQDYADRARTAYEALLS
jgi:glycosyltransferase involved in cell wall biosynthesis